MPVADRYRPSPRLPELGEGFFDAVAPARFPEHALRWRNDRHAARVGLDTLTDEEWMACFARFEPLPDNLREPLAMRYHGHQFRVYNPQLGDGRGFLYAQLEDDARRLLDLGTKGSGRTPYSRGGDGRLTLKGACESCSRPRCSRRAASTPRRPSAWWRPASGSSGTTSPRPRAPACSCG
ncbi:MAG: protein adenylyltransferase SelO family protein [Sandaracinaceae bacterium]|nr:protein adenylyltransferase SelO family protein [Sandaracinaceae bacterium]